MARKLSWSNGWDQLRSIPGALTLAVGRDSTGPLPRPVEGPVVELERAMLAEARTASRFALLTAVPVLGLLLVSVLNDAFPTMPVDDARGSADFWTTSLVVLLLLLVALQLVNLVLVQEHRCNLLVREQDRGRGPRRSRWRRHLVLWSLRLLVTAAALTAIGVVLFDAGWWPDEPVEVERCGGVLELAVLGLVAVVRFRIDGRSRRSVGSRRSVQTFLSSVVLWAIAVVAAALAVAAEWAGSDADRIATGVAGAVSAVAAETVGVVLVLSAGIWAASGLSRESDVDETRRLRCTGAISALLACIGGVIVSVLEATGHGWLATAVAAFVVPLAVVACSRLDVRRRSWPSVALPTVLVLVAIGGYGSVLAIQLLTDWSAWVDPVQQTFGVGESLLALLVSVFVLVSISVYSTSPSVVGLPVVHVARRFGTDDSALTIAMSGGGIRASAFVLGGYQATQERPGVTAPHLESESSPEPAVFAVSGGSYVASALALRRAFEVVTGQVKSSGVPWTASYVPGSPEMERLRRHTRYLFEPTWRTRDGVVSLLAGAAVNLFVAGTGLFVLVWFGSQLTATLGLYDVQVVGPPVNWVERASLGHDLAGQVVSFGAATGEGDWWRWLGIPAVAAAAFVALTLMSWSGARIFEDKNATTRERERALGLLDRPARWRFLLVVLAAGWLGLVLGLPALAGGLAQLTTSNKPTATVAGQLAALGLATPEMCEHAFRTDVIQTVREVTYAAGRSPGVARQGTAGACGDELEVTRTVGPDGGGLVTDLIKEPRLRRVEAQALGSYTANTSLDLSQRIAAVGGLLLAVLGALRRGPSPGETGSTTSRLGSLKRTAMTWLPLAVMALLALYLAVLWSRTFLVSPEDQLLRTSVLVAVVGCLFAFLLDANLTTMHSFYRSRLSSAFAVGVAPDDRADTLPDQVVYRFSQLQESAARPRLHVVATLNTQAANESPTKRGGFPLVFGPTHVEVHRERGRRISQAAAKYENFAGPGRVSIMAMVGMSGAAVSPLMGRYAAQYAPYRLLLALFNIRLGIWVRNPAHTVDRDGSRGLLWMTSKPGLAQVALEAAGSSSADRRWVYLSDGGHLDNTGMVEAVRHRIERPLAGGGVGRVLVLDASNDPAGSWQAVGEAIAVVRADLDVDLRRDLDPELPPWARRYVAADLDVLVVKAVRVEPLTDEQRKEDPKVPDWWALLPPDVQTFQAQHADFPRAATPRQNFGDLEFEAYRAYAHAATTAAFAAAGWPS